MPEKPREAILEGVTWVILQSDSDELLQARLGKLCEPFTNRLQQIAGALTTATQEAAVFTRQLGMLTEILVIMNFFGTLFKSSLTTPSSPASIYLVFAQVWPFAISFSRAFSHSEELVEGVLRIVKYSMRKCREQFANHLNDIVYIVTNGFSQHPYSAYLYTAENLVRTYGGEVACFEILSSLFLTLTQTVTRLLDSAQAIKEKPEITEDFFGMVVRYINYCAPAVLRSEALLNIVHCAKLGVGIEQPDAAVCLYGFILRLLIFADENSSSYDPRVSEDIKRHLAEIVALVFRALVSGMPRIIVDTIIDLLCSIQRIFGNEGWLANAVMTEVPHDCMTDLEKVKMIQEAANPTVLTSTLYNLNRRAHVRAKRLKK